MNKMILITTIFFLGVQADPIRMINHEEAHYEKAADYGLNPTFDYDNLEVDYFPGTNGQILDIVGAGIEREYEINYELSKLHIPNSPYSYVNLYRFHNRLSDDGKDYHSYSEGHSDILSSAMIIEPVLMLSQLYFSLSGSKWYLHSRYEMDRRGIVAYYEISYGFDW